MLIVVSDVGLEIDGDGEPTTSGGRLRYMAPWLPADDDLRPVAFTHTPPALLGVQPRYG